MTHHQQPRGSSVCGQTCVAIISGVTVDQAIAAVGKGRQKTSENDLQRGLKACGFVLGLFTRRPRHLHQPPHISEAMGLSDNIIVLPTDSTGRPLTSNTVQVCRCDKFRHPHDPAEHHPDPDYGFTEAAEQQVKEQVTPEQLLAVRAESLYEQIGGDLCICQQAEVMHWCEKCQERIAYILTVFVRLRGEAANAALADCDLAREALEVAESRAECFEASIGDLKGQLKTTRVELATLNAEVVEAMRVLDPNMPESGLVDACKQVKQVAISEADNSEKAEADLLSAREELKEAVVLVAGILEERADDNTKAACDACERCSALVMCSYHSVLSELSGRIWIDPAIEREHLKADLKLAREELATLTAQCDAYKNGIHDVSNELTSAEAELARLQPYVQHPAYCRIWTRRCSVPIIENGVVRGMRSPTKDEIEAVTCNCGLLPLQPEQKKGART